MEFRFGLEGQMGFGIWVDGVHKKYICPTMKMYIESNMGLLMIRYLNTGEVLLIRRNPMRVILRNVSGKCVNDPQLKVQDGRQTTLATSPAPQ